jgi:hypothetical protein
MGTATTDTHLTNPAFTAGVVVGYASCGPVLLAGTTPVAPKRH